jgi:hypothetical protein
VCGAWNARACGLYRRDGARTGLVPWFSTLDDASNDSAFGRALSATGAVRQILRSLATGDADAPGLEIASLTQYDGSRLVAVAFPDTSPTCGDGARRTPPHSCIA